MKELLTGLFGSNDNDEDEKLSADAARMIAEALSDNDDGKSDSDPNEQAAYLNGDISGSDRDEFESQLNNSAGLREEVITLSEFRSAVKAQTVPVPEELLSADLGPVETTTSPAAGLSKTFARLFTGPLSVGVLGSAVACLLLVVIVNPGQLIFQNENFEIETRSAGETTTPSADESSDGYLTVRRPENKDANSRADDNSRDSDRTIEVAIADYTKKIELNPQDASIYKGRGRSYFRKGDYELAIADFSQAIKLNPDDPDAYNDRGVAYIRAGNYGKATADFNQAISINPELAIAYLNRGLTYQKMGEPGLADADFDQAVRLDNSLAKFRR